MSEPKVIRGSVRMAKASERDMDADDNTTVHAHAKPTYRQGFARLWREINGTDSWAANPWVWVVDFRKVTP